MENGYEGDIWWMTLLKGLTLLLLGLIVLIWPGLTFVLLVTFFSAYLLIAGVFNIIIGIGSVSSRSSWFLTLLLGVAEIALGVYLIRNPELALATFIIFVGATFMVQGIIAIIIALFELEGVGERFLAILMGILAIIAGFAVIKYPVSSGVAFVWIMGAYALIMGAVDIATSFGMRGEMKEAERAAARRAAAAKR